MFLQLALIMCACALLAMAAWTKAATGRFYWLRAATFAALCFVVFVLVFSPRGLR